MKDKKIRVQRAKPGQREDEIAAALKARAFASGGAVSFPGMVTQNGHILHFLEHNKAVWFKNRVYIQLKR